MRSLLLLRNGHILIGAGDGTVDLVTEYTKKGRGGPDDVGLKVPSQPVLHAVRKLSSNYLLIRTIISSDDLAKVNPRKGIRHIFTVIQRNYDFGWYRKLRNFFHRYGHI